MSARFITFDEFIDVESSLLALNSSLAQIPSNPLFWKSVILTTHSALQGACVCILTQSHGGGALTKKDEKAHLRYLNRRSEIAVARAQGDALPDPLPRPRTNIQNLPGLLRRLPAPLSVNCPKTEEDLVDCNDLLASSLFRLHEFRTEFSHFPVVSWSIELAGLPSIIDYSLRHTKAIIESDQFSRVNRFHETQVNELIDKAALTISNLGD